MIIFIKILSVKFKIEFQENIIEFLAFLRKLQRKKKSFVFSSL